MFVELADPFVDEFDATELLHDLARHAARVSGAEAVGVMLELLHLQADEGPCIDCFISREPVVNADLATAGDLWPRARSRSWSTTPSDAFHLVRAATRPHTV